MPGIAGLYFEVLGPPGGTPVILSAGLGGIAEYWRPNLAALTERHRVILYDHRGTARSDRAIPENHSIGDMANDILAVLDGLGVERAHLIGHALGGLIGLCLALKAPERLISLVAVNAWAKLDPHTRGCFETRLLLLRNSGSDAFIKAHPLFLYPAPWISSHMAQLEMDVDLPRAWTKSKRRCYPSPARTTCSRPTPPPGRWPMDFPAAVSRYCLAAATPAMSPNQNPLTASCSPG
jgi:aminoacrylate hydrolase